MKKKIFDENKVYKSIDEIRLIGSCRRKCKFICERCNSEFSYAIDVILKKDALLCKECSAKSTNMKRLGVEHPAQSASVLSKMKETSINRYGKESFSQTDKGREICRQTALKESSISARKQGFLKKYGVDNPGKIPGRTTKKTYYLDGYSFDSSWELLFYERYLKGSSHAYEVHPKVKFDYIYNGEVHCYLPDFRVDGVYLDIKADFFFNEDGVMINPWDITDTKPAARQQCMKENNVKVLTSKELKELGVL